LFLESLGWSVVLFSRVSGDVVVQELKNREINILKMLKYPPSFYCSLVRNKIVERMHETIVNDLHDSEFSKHNRLIVESHTLTLSLWGELLAEKMRCKHIVFLLEEKFRGLTKTQLEYLDFKHKRK